MQTWPMQYIWPSRHCKISLPKNHQKAYALSRDTPSIFKPSFIFLRLIRQ